MATEKQGGTVGRTCSRRFDWISSVHGDKASLAELDGRMSEFYSQPQLRDSYQKMLDGVDEGLTSPSAIADAALDQICQGADADTRTLEIGCGNGRTYQQLQVKGYPGHYLGIEMAEYIIETNRARYPGARWRRGSIYEIVEADETFDRIFTFYVLEHTVYPERALSEMLRALKPGGRLVLVFPDFVATGQMPSQMTGFGTGTTSTKLRQGRLLDACVSLYDNRVRLPHALDAAVETQGPFPVNLQPLCFLAGVAMSADVDATYVASKAEVRAWFGARGHLVQLPAGEKGLFRLHSLLVVTKGSGQTS